MIRSTQYIWLAILFGLLLTIAHCYQKCYHGFKEISPIQSPLINPFKSYMSVEDVKQMFPFHSKNWKVVEDYSFSYIERFPQFHIYSVVIENYNYLNHSGQLVLTFYNNRLAITLFSLIRKKSYLDIVKKIEGIKIASNTSFDKIKIKPYTHIQLISSFPDSMINEYYHNEYQSMIEWADVRLLREEEQWISCYSDD